MDSDLPPLPAQKSSTMSPFWLTHLDVDLGCEILGALVLDIEQPLLVLAQRVQTDLVSAPAAR